MTPAEKHVARMRQHREELEYALARGVSLGAAHDYFAQMRLATIEARRRARDAARAPITTAATEERPLYWWQKD